MKKNKLLIFFIIYLSLSSFSFAYLEDDKNEILKQFNYVEEDALQPVLRALYDKGMESYSINDFKNAAFYFRKVLDIDKTYKNTDFLVEAMEKMQNYPLYEAKETVVTDYYEKGRDYYIKGQYLKSLNIWEKLLVLNPDQSDIIKSAIQDARRLLADPYYETGWKYYKEGNFDKAIEEWEQVLALDPTYHGLASLLEQTRQKSLNSKINDLVAQAKDAYEKDSIKRSIALINQALKLNSNYQAAISLKKLVIVRADKLYSSYFNTALGFYKKNNYEDSIANFSKCLDFILDDARKQNEVRDYIRKARYELAVLEKEAPEKAVQEVVQEAPAEEIRTVDEEEVRNHYNKGLYYYRNGYLDKAIAEWEIVLNLDPENERAYTSLQRAKSELEKQNK